MGTQEPARVRIAWWDRAAITGLGAAGAALSFDALQQMAAAIHVRQELVWLFPLVIDGFIAYGVRALVVLRDTSFAARLYVWTLFAAATATSIWANGLHAVRLNQQTPGQAGLHLGDLTVGVLSTAAPLALAGAVHLYILIARRAATTPTADGYLHHAGTTSDGPAAAVPGTAGDGPALTARTGTAGDGSPSPSRPSRRPAHDITFPHPSTRTTTPEPPPPAGPGPLLGPVADESWPVRPRRTDPSPAPGEPAHLSAPTSADTAADRPGTAPTPPVPQPSPVPAEDRSGAAGGSDIPAPGSSGTGDGPVSDPSPGPDRSEGRSGDSSGMAQQQGEVDHLLPLARDAVQQARRISRDVVRSGLREHGIQISNRRLGALLRALRNEAAPATTSRSARD